MPIIFDSNIWIAYLDQNDSQHKKAVVIFERHASMLILPEQILFEVVTVLHLKAGVAHAKKFLELALENEAVEVMYSSKNIMLELLRFFQKTARQKLSLTDHLLLMLSAKHEILTLDRDLAKALAS